MGLDTYKRVREKERRELTLRLGKELGYLEIAFKCQKVKKNLRKRSAYLKVKGATSRAPNGQIWDSLSRKISRNNL